MANPPAPVPPADNPDDHYAPCALCGTPNPLGARRCSDCGYHLEASGPRPFSRPALWALAAMVLAIYVVSLAVVAIAR